MNDETLNIPETDETVDAASETLPEETVEASEQQATQTEANDTRDNIPETESDMRENIRTLQEQVENLKRDVQDNVDGWQRSRAEFTNYKKRVTRELAESREKASLDTLTKMLPVFDDFERALDNIPEDLADHPWVSGTSLILKKFEKVLDDYDVEILDPVGEPFNPTQHEAIGIDDSSDYEPEHVTVTLQKGYISGDRVLRPALVRVSG